MKLRLLCEKLLIISQRFFGILPFHLPECRLLPEPPELLGAKKKALNISLRCTIGGMSQAKTEILLSVPNGSDTGSEAPARPRAELACQEEQL
jgi:hypothetical protein